MALHIRNKKSTSSSSMIKLKISVFFFVLFTSLLFGQSNTCNISLSVDKQRNVRSTPMEGTYYSMLLTNNATVASTYSLNAAYSNLDCQNPDNSNAKDNVELTIQFLDVSQKPIKEISIQAGQTIKFFVRITVPINTNLNKWSCTEIIASSKECKGYDSKTLLKTLVIGSNED